VAKDDALAEVLTQTVVAADNSMVSLDFQGGINSIMDFCKRVNGFVTEKEPWVVAKDESRNSELMAILYNTADAIRALAVLLHPVMPATCEILWSSLGADKTLGAIADQKIMDVANWGQLPSGSKVVKGAVLFPRLEEKEVAK
jgi:methionyl-tRNA synthetase